MSARARELFGLLPVSLLVTGGFTAVLITRSDVIETVTVTYLGSSLMFFGAFLALLYVATARISLVAGGFGLFAVGGWFFASTVEHVKQRFEIRADPFAPDVVDDE